MDFSCPAMSDKWFHLLNLWHPIMNCLKNDDIPWFETWCDHASLLNFVSCETCIFLPMVSFSRYLITLLMHFLIHWERELFFFFSFREGNLNTIFLYDLHAAFSGVKTEEALIVMKMDHYAMLLLFIIGIL